MKTLEYKSFLAPITFGITGHRDVVPEDLDRAKKCIQNVVKKYRARFPTTPIIFLSPIAAGADCAAAEAALESDDNIYLHIIFPFDVNEYKKTIDLDWHQSFENLRSHKKVISSTTINNKINLTESEINQCYLDVGEFVATHSYVLFALKNTDPPIKKGGAADIVEFRKRGCINLLRVDDSNIRCAEEGILYEIRVRRDTENDRALPRPSEKDDVYLITPSSTGKSNKAKAMFILGLNKNSTALNFIKKIGSLITSTKNSDLSVNQIELMNKRGLALHENATHEADRSFDKPNIYTNNLGVICSNLASEYQKKYRYCLYATFSMAIIVAILHGFEKNTFEFLQRFPLAKYIFAGLAISIWWFSKTKGYKHIYESYRALSEGINVQKYWYQAGIDKSPADYFLANQINENSWVRRVLRTLWLQDFSALLQKRFDPPLTSASDLSKLESSWLIYQIGYFEQKIEGFEYLNTIFNRIINFLIAITAGFYLMSYEPIYKAIGITSIEIETLKAISETTLILLAITKAYVEMNAYDVLIKRYEASLQMYRQSKKIFDQLNSLSEKDAHDSSIDKLKSIRDLYLIVGQSYLDEVSDWFIVNSRIEFKRPGVD